MSPRWQRVTIQSIGAHVAFIRQRPTTNDLLTCYNRGRQGGRPEARKAGMKGRPGGTETPPGGTDKERTMKYGSLAGVSDRVSRLVMGSMIFSMERFELTRDLLDHFVEAGGTTVDTARVYAKGSSEKAFGEWLKLRECRDRMVVIGKGAHHDSLTFERRVNPAAIHEDIETTRREMQLDVIDVYILHKDDPDADVGPIVQALNEEVDAGRIKAFGGSSWTHQRIQAANDYAAARGLRP